LTMFPLSVSEIRSMARLTIQVRTQDNLLDLLARGESPAWIVAKDKQERITHVQIVN
jgi:hypothetical protein